MSEVAKGHLAMLLFSLLVAGSFALGGIVANDIAPTALNAMRFVIAGALIGGAALVTGGIPRSTWVAPWRYLILGGLFAVYFVLMFEGLKTAPPISTAAVFTLTPVLSALAGYMLLRQITTAWMAAALAVGGAGALWVIFRADLAALLAFKIGKGEAIYFVGCVAHAIYTPMIRKLNRGESPLVFSFGTICAGILVLLVWGWGDIVSTNWLALPAVIWITILYVAICASAVTFVLVQFATLRLPSAKVMAYTYLTPSWVILWQVALGNGAPPPAVLIGVALTAVALLMLLRSEA
ncbi:MAG: DMT family transporter [Pseudomonadota bacterium]